MNFSIVHEFDTDVKTYWDVFLSPEFSEALMAALKMKNYRVLRREDDGKVFRRSQSMEPTVALPAMFAKLVPSMGYTEHDTLTWATNTMRIVIEPASMKDKFKTEGDYVVTPLGDKRCRREFRGEVKMSVPLIGGKMEAFTVEQMKESYETATRVTREWLAKRAAG
jgi:hypothetical protein